MVKLRNRVLFVAVLVVLVAFFCNSSWAEIYKWVDKNGAVHFSDKLPANQKKDKKIKSIPEAPPSTGQETAKETPSGQTSKKNAASDQKTAKETPSGQTSKKNAASDQKTAKETPSGQTSKKNAASSQKTATDPAESIVELYVKGSCKDCEQAKDYLRSNKISFTEYDTEKDARAAGRRRNIDNRNGDPLAVINGKIVIGFSKESYQRALKRGS
ncbi:MAG: DUF4124 domain-containing protein [Desulfobacteraceae bacterium]|nr:DUF4124 domain-containing protein [Desulfobacteraceae bacterium]